MPGRVLDRRTFSGLALAAALAGPRAHADPQTGTRLPSEDDVYEPPRASRWSPISMHG